MINYKTFNGVYFKYFNINMTYHTMMYASYGGSVLYYYTNVYHIIPHHQSSSHTNIIIPFKIGLRPPIIMTNPNYHHHHLHRFYYSHYFFLYVLHYYVSIYLNFHHKTMLYMYLKLDGDVYLI